VLLSFVAPAGRVRRLFEERVLPFRRVSASGKMPSIRVVWIVAALLVLLVLCSATLVILHNRSREVDQEGQELKSFGTALSEQTTRALQSVELVVDDVAKGLAAGGLDTPADLTREVTGDGFFATLRARTAGLPQLDAISIIGADGKLLNFSRYQPVPAVNVADRDYFQMLRDHPAMQFFLSAPVQNRGTGTWTIYVARRLSGPGRRFIGLVLGAIELSYFETFYSEIDLGSGSTIAMWRRDGTLLARFPLVGEVGRNFAQGRQFNSLAADRQRVLISRASIDGQLRLMVATRLPNEPLIITVSRTIDSVLADWWHDSIVIAASAVVCALAILAIAVFFVRQIRAYASLAEAVAARDEAERGRRAAEVQLLQAQKLEAIGQVAAGVAHDFNNLLMVVLSNAELLGAMLKGDAQSERRLATISQAVDRGSALTQQMLAFSRQQLLAPDSLDLSGALRGIEELLRSSLGGTVELELRLDPALWPVHADPGQVEHAVLNLVINARNAMPEGGRVTIATANRRIGPDETVGQLGPGDYVTLTVGDSGVGMTAEVAARAFEPFFTTRERGQGSGLGLSQVFGFVRQSQGDVLIDTAPGKGTRISILLPRVVGGAAVPPRGTAAPPRGSAEPGRTVVMVVDDDDDVREAVVSMLEEQSVAVVQAASGPAALQLLTGDARVGLVLTDFAMPGMTGAELAQQVRHSKPDIPVVFMTGYARPEPLLSERWVLRKPFTAQFLTDMLAQALAV
jgi:signal transduction histidine kinase/CheY-like chemotaxis protein